MTDFDVSKMLWNAVDALRATLQEDVVEALLREAAKQAAAAKGVSLFNHAAAGNGGQTSANPSLVAAAQMLLSLPPLERLDILEAIISRHSARHGRLSEMWMQLPAARHLAAFSQEAASVRCAHEPSLVPAILTALDAKERGIPRHVRFVGWSVTAVEMASRLALILDVTIECVRGNPVLREDAGAFDLEIIMPPFGATLTPPEELPMTTQNRLGRSGVSGRVSEEAIAMADVLANATGRVVLSVTPAVLFRTVGIEPGLREDLLSSGRLRAVLSVPGGTAHMTTLIKSSLLVVDPQGADHDTVRFVDLADPAFTRATIKRRIEFRPDADWASIIGSALPPESPFAVDVPSSRIQAESGILSVERYLMADVGEKVRSFARSHEGVELADVVDFIRPMPILGRGESGEHVVREALPRDISERGYLKRPEKRVEIEAGIFRKVLQQAVKPGDVLLSVKGTIGTVGLVPEEMAGDEDEVWVAGQSFMILRPKRRLGLSPIVLYEYLTNEVVQEHLRSLAGGAAIQSLNMKDIKSFPVPVPDQKTTEQVETEHARRQAVHDKIEELTASLARDRERSWPHDELKGGS
jgi:type I restriction-modification system DNA methylase subunit